MMDDDSVPFDTAPGPSCRETPMTSKAVINNNPEVINLLLTISEQMSIMSGKLDRLEAQMKTAMSKINDIEGVVKSLRLPQGGSGTMRTSTNRSSRK